MRHTIIQTTDAPLIDIRNATIYRGDTLVFEGLNLSIDQHEQAAVLGPNGSGKTTLLKVINREIYPVRRDDSWVRILGREIWNVWELRAHIGIVSNELQMRYRNTTTGLDVVLSGYLSSVGIQGLLARQLTNEQKNHALEVMQQLGIESLTETCLRNMSTGQQRRCLLARALVHNPDTLILDEPTAGLDLGGREDLVVLLAGLAADETSPAIVMVTHHVDEIPPGFEHVLLLKDGHSLIAGAIERTLTSDWLRECFGLPLSVERRNGRWSAWGASQGR